jgi:succinate-semialdehyde dehydrogenase/glutarate-semialdehyde dehydrogenase
VLGVTLSDAAPFVDRAYIGGDWCPAQDGKRSTVENSAAGAVIGAIADCEGRETRDAIRVAATTFEPCAPYLTDAARRESA